MLLSLLLSRSLSLLKAGLWLRSPSLLSNEVGTREVQLLPLLLLYELSLYNDPSLFLKAGLWLRSPPLLSNEVGTREVRLLPLLLLYELSLYNDPSLLYDISLEFSLLR